MSNLITFNPCQADGRCEPTDGVVGILGGMGPLATVDFLSKMLVATPAASDQEHVPSSSPAFRRFPTGRALSAAKATRRRRP